jgi:outer membrane protein assembly factor BamB/orotate phosphoribosyltransferase
MDQELVELKSRILNRGMFWGEHNYPNGFYWDMREVILEGKWLKIVSQRIWDKIKKHQPELIFGTGTGAIPLLSAIQMIASDDGVELSTLIVRESRKDRNRRKIIEGTLPKTAVRSVFIDDMMNYGGTYEGVMKILEEEGVELNVVACGMVLDKWIPIGSRTLEANGIAVERIFTRHDIGVSRIDPWVWEGVFKSKLEGTRLFTRKIINRQAWRNMEANANFDYIKSPVVMDDENVYWSTDYGKLVCSSKKTGETKWELQQKRFVLGKIINYPWVDSEHVYVNGYDGVARKLDKKTGEVVWLNKVCSTIHSASVVDYDRGHVYLCTEYTPDKGSILCLDKETGIQKWKYEVDSWIPCTPNFKDGVVVAASNKNCLYAVNAENGELLWKYNTTDKVRGQVNFIGNRVCSFDESGMFRMNDIQTGELLFERCFGRSYHSFIKYDQQNHQIIFTNKSSDGYMIALAEDGTQRWLCNFRGEQLWSPQLFNNKILTVSYKGYLCVVDAKTGEKLACDFLNYKVSSPPAWDADYLAINSLSQGLFMYRI